MNLEPVTRRTTSRHSNPSTRSAVTLAAALAAVVLLFGEARASFSVSPQRVDLKLSGGQRQVIEFLIVNEDTALPHTIRCFPSGFEQMPNGAYQLTANPDTLRTCHEWFRLDTTELKLGPKKSGTVKVEVRVPPGVVGTRYGAVAFEEEGRGRLKEDGAGVSISFLSPAFVHVTVPGANTSPKLQLIRLKATPPSEFSRFLPRGSSGNSFGFTALLANTGANLATVHGDVVLRNEHGRIARKFRLASGSILPGAAVECLSLIPKLEPGNYAAEITAWFGTPSPMRASATLSVTGSGTSFDSVATAADVNIQTDVDVLELKAAPGGVHSGYLPVRNTGRTDALLTARMAPLVQNERGELLPAESAGVRDCCNWLALSEDSLRVAAGRSALVKFTCKVPAEARGGYYSGLLLEQPTSDKVGTFVEVPILVNVRGGKRDASLSMSDVKTGPLRVSARLQNQGDEYLQPNVSVIVYRSRVPTPVADFDWENVVTLPCDQQDPIVLPGRELPLNATWHDHLEPGLYRVTVIADMGQGLRKTESRTITLQ
jgi:hypothetical protein